jgi:hypothetical protein
MKKHLPWALWWLCTAPACVLQSESIPIPSPWEEVDSRDGSVFTEGKVGIGTDAPATQLEVVGDVKATRYFLTDSSYLALDATGGLALWGGGVEGLDVQAGLVSIPTSLYVAGVCFANCASDARLKKDVKPLEGALARLLRLRGVTFEWIDPAAHGPRERDVQTGFIAQEVEAVFPEWVAQGADGHRRLTIRGFEALSVEALRELTARNRGLAERVRTLEETSARLSIEVRALRERDARVSELADELASERRARAGLEARLAVHEAAARGGRKER